MHTKLKLTDVPVIPSRLIFRRLVYDDGVRRVNGEIRSEAPQQCNIAYLVYISIYNLSTLFPLQFV
jgi:hypothetical protein